MTKEVKVTQADKLCAQAIRESVSAATSDMIAARHRIAAQAELLEALEAILPIYEEWTKDCGHDPSVGIDCTDDFSRIERARAAIAKAKGEA